MDDYGPEQKESQIDRALEWTPMEPDGLSRIKVRRTPSPPFILAKILKLLGNRLKPLRLSYRLSYLRIDFDGREARDRDYPPAFVASENRLGKALLIAATGNPSRARARYWSQNTLLTR